jgi:hypothetical protein
MRKLPARLGAAGVLLFAQIVITACQPTTTQAHRLEPIYDKATGKLSVLKYDSDGDGRIDTWSYMDGARVVRIEIDTDGDGTIDRWEYYDANQKLEKVGFSRANDGQADAWSYANPDGSLARIEISTHRDGRITRVEHYEKDVLVSAEENTNGGGGFDKWELYDGARLASVAFDTMHRGRADRRLTYSADGTVRVEIDAAGDGRFVPAPDAERATVRRP